MQTGGYSIANPFNIVLPDQLSEVDLKYLSEHLRANLLGRAEIDELFLSHIRLALSIISKYARHVPHLINDLIQVAMLSIAESINRYALGKVKTDNLSGYIASRIHYALIDDIYKDNCLSTGRWIRQQKANDPNFKPVYVRHLSAEIEFERADYLDDEIRTTQRGQKAALLKDKLSVNLLEPIVVMDTIEHCIDADKNLRRREYKKAVIRLRAAGYNNREISEIIDLAESYVQFLLADVRSRYEKMES